MNIAVSILNCNNVDKFLNNIYEINKKLSNVKDTFKIYIHFDVMDQKFVQQKGINIEYIKKAKAFDFYIDTHLMVKYPIQDKYIQKVLELGSDCIIIHYEIPDFEKVLDYLNKLASKTKKIKIGVSIKPETDINVLTKYSQKFSKILIMSVSPGLGGQKYIHDINKKLNLIKKAFPNHEIEVDGGINDSTIIEPLEMNIDNYVIGSYFTNDEENLDLLNDKLIRLNIIKDIWTHNKDRNIEFDKKLLQITDNGYRSW